MDVGEFRKRVENVQIKEVKVCVDWKLVPRKDRLYCLYPIIVLELDGKTKKVSFPEWPSGVFPPRFTKLKTALLYLVQGHTLSKPSEGSLNHDWLAYRAKVLHSKIVQKVRAASRRKDINKQIDKFIDRRHRGSAISNLQIALKVALTGGLRKQDILAVLERVSKEIVVSQIMDT